MQVSWGFADGKSGPPVCQAEGEGGGGLQRSAYLAEGRTRDLGDSGQGNWWVGRTDWA